MSLATAASSSSTGVGQTPCRDRLRRQILQPGAAHLGDTVDAAAAGIRRYRGGLRWLRSVGAPVQEILRVLLDLLGVVGVLQEVLRHNTFQAGLPDRELSVQLVEFGLAPGLFGIEVRGVNHVVSLSNSMPMDWITHRCCLHPDAEATHRHTAHTQRMTESDPRASGAGTPMAVIAKWLGHANAAITAQVYTHSQDPALAAATKTLGAVVTLS